MNFAEMCRFCLRAERNMCPLFDTDLNQFSSVQNAVMDLLRSSAKIEIFEGDGFPNKICKNCLNKFHQIYAFVLLCKKSDVVLKQLKDPVVYLNRLKIIPNNPEVIYEKIECFETEETALDFESYWIDGNEEEEYILPVNTNEFLSQESVYEHLESTFESDGSPEADEVDNEFFRCPDCSIECMTIKLLQQHICENHVVDKLCKICDEEFECSALQHCCKHLPVDPDSTDAFIIKPNKKCLCVICEKTFQSKAGYDDHLQLFIQQLSFECGICATVFRSKVNLNDHMKQSHGIVVNLKKWKLDCSVCFEIFSSQSELIKHMREGHTDDSQACTICFQTFPNAIVLANHMITSHTEKNSYSCEKCSLIFTSKSGYVNHFEKIHDEPPFKCDICPQTFRNENTLAAHKFSHPNEKKVWICDICSQRFAQETDLFKHMYLSHSDSNWTGYKCETCSKLFRYKRSLVAHEKCHSALKQYQCAICFERFQEKNDLIDHARSVHPHNRSHKCEMCPAVFIYRESLREHMKEKHVLLNYDESNIDNASRPAIFHGELNLTEYRETHLGKIRYNCGNCDRTYSNKYTLLEHIRVNHSRTKPKRHQCNQCQRSFTGKTGLQNHIHVMHAVDALKCEICSKRLGSEMRKAIHMRTHTGERPIQCKICLKTLRYECNLKPHMIVMHPELSDSTGYKCEICSKICSTKSKLATHERKHKSERPFQCDICDKRFKCGGTVRTHKRVTHGIIEPKGSRWLVPETVEAPETVGTHKKGPKKMPSIEPIQCKICMKTLQNKKYLRTHVMVLHPESSKSSGYKCEICSKICVSRNKLTVHERRHKPDKPFECDICGDRFKYRPNIRTHKRCKHGIVERKGSHSRIPETVEMPETVEIALQKRPEKTQNVAIELPPNESVEIPISETAIEFDLSDLILSVS